MLKIGNVSLPLGLMLAPMAGYTDYAMRTVAKECGAEYLTTEMVSAKAVCFGDEKTHLLARIREEELPAAVQIFGREPDVMARAAGILSRGEEGFAAPVAIDINMGCPVPKIFGNGEGSALMRDPELIRRIVCAVKGETDLPVTVKMRAGIDEDHRTAVECALAAESGGAALVAIHGRTRNQMYSGKADRKIIENVKNALQIPVIANGDVASGADAVAMLAETGADGIMVGRGAVGRPHVFGEIRAALRGEAYHAPTPEERIALAVRQLTLAIEDKGEARAVREARGQLAAYLYGFRGAATARAAIHEALTRDDVLFVLDGALAASLSEQNG